MSGQDFEGLGTFYLGKAYDLERGARGEELVLYDARDLTTHAVCVGMTGSGKTGLCTALIEEAAIDGIPALVVDPKGDLANLLLTFPALSEAEFRPWVDPADARRTGVAESELAARSAQRWRNGLAEWGQGPERIARLRAAADFALYTPGSTAGAPLSILSSFRAPSAETSADPEALRERASASATGLCALIGLSADPVTSREHILLARLLERAWAAGRDLELGALIRAVQEPPIQTVGVLDLESFFPQKDRFQLAHALNNLLASPGFAAWMEGEPLDVEALLHTSAGKPRVSILSIAHLSDAERMFFVALLFSEVVAWMRRQPGTSSLRALLYMDEVAGYLPPVANPPSKTPLLTLLKQARAFGLGVVLATQNPVDLDYKALSNAGTWFVGRLSTERDKARLLDGLEGAAAGGSFDRASIERAISRLQTRIFLMSNVHEDHPQVFETRWAMSYLRGPLTRAQMRELARAHASAKAPAQRTEIEESSATATLPSSTERSSTPAADAGADRARAPVARAKSAGRTGAPEADASSPQRNAAPASQVPASPTRPVLPPDVPQVFLPLSARTPPGASVVWRAHVLGLARVHWADTRTGARADREVALLAVCGDGMTAVDWKGAEHIEASESELGSEPEIDAAFAPPPAAAARPKAYPTWGRALVDHLFRSEVLELWQSAGSGLVSHPGEREGAFRVRVAQAAREERDAATEKLRKKYAPRLAVLSERIRRARAQVEVQSDQAEAAKVSTWASLGSTLLGAFTGRKLASSGNLGRAASSARSVSRSSKEAADVERARADVAALEQQHADLESEFQAEARALAQAIDASAERLERVRLSPKKRDCVVRSVSLAWVPFHVDAQGVARRI
jgi:hypothetical protein